MNQIPGTWKRSNLQCLAACLVLGIIWLLEMPYEGIIHDARLYTFQALLVLHPETMGSDPFASNTPQTAYQFFDVLYAQAINFLGISKAHLLMLLLGHAFWISSAALLCSVLYRDRLWFFALGALYVLPRTYGDLMTFEYAEHFVSPRIYSESLVMLMLWAVMRSRWIGGGLLGGLALATHPLMSISGVLTGVAWRFPWLRWERWLGILGAGLFLGLGATGFEPFALLFQGMDDAWLDIVQGRNAFAFLRMWKAEAYQDMAARLCVVAAAGLALRGRRRRLILAATAVFILTMAASYVFGDLLSRTLILQLQLWRSGWLLAVLTNALVPAVYLRVRRCGYIGVAGVVFLVTPFFSLLPGWYGVCFGFIGLGLIGTSSAKRTILRAHPPNPAILRSLLLVAGAYAVGSLSQHLLLHTMTSGVQVAADKAFWESACWKIISIVMLLFVWSGKGGARVVQFVGLAVLAAAVIMYGWNQEQPVMRYMLDGDERLQTFAKAFPAGANIYWPGNLTSVWFMLQRPHFISEPQGAGVILSRKLAQRYQELEKLAALDKAASVYPFSNTPLAILPRDFFAGKGGDEDENLTPDHEVPLYSMVLLRWLCVTQPELDFVIFPIRVDGAIPVASLDVPFSYRAQTRPAYGLVEHPQAHAYGCDAIRLDQKAKDGERRLH